jgi:2-polyprenyl-3-methyl-5-hydroxy-6-metoxy-1,4-benzoquinol methylase
MDAVNASMRKAVLQRFQYAQEFVVPKEGAAVLDVGCGSGVYSEAFLNLPISSYTGVDVSDQMLALAKSRLTTHEGRAKADFIEADFMDWETDQRFDYAIAMGVFDYSSDPISLIRKMAGLVDRRLAISLPSHSRFHFRSSLRRLRYRFFGKGDVYYYSADSIERMASAVGAVSHTVRDLGKGQGFFVSFDLA